MLLKAVSKLNVNAQFSHQVSSLVSTTLQSGSSSRYQSGGSISLHSESETRIKSQMANFESVNGDTSLSSNSKTSITSKYTSLESQNDVTISAKQALFLSSSSGLSSHGKSDVSIRGTQGVDIESQAQDFALNSHGFSANSNSQVVIGSSKEMFVESDSRILLNAPVVDMHSGSEMVVESKDISVQANNGLAVISNNGAGLFHLSQNGNFAIGRSDGINKMHVAGDMLVSGRITAAEYVSPSDVQLKENIQPFPEQNSSVANVKALRGVRYDWNKAAELFGIKSENNRTMIGVIAQEVELLFPELVKQWQEGYKTVDYSRLNTVLLEAIKENQKYLMAMKQRIFKLKKTIAEKELSRNS